MFIYSEVFYLNFSVFVVENSIKIYIVWGKDDS